MIRPQRRNPKFLSACLLTGLYLPGCSLAGSSPSPKASGKEIMSTYLTKIQKYDGIDRTEALLLAQSQIIFYGYDKDYYVDDPVVVFEDKDLWKIKFYPHNRTFAEVTSKPEILVEVNKVDGEIQLRKLPL